MKICIIDDCCNKHRGLGYCLKHYTRFKKYGHPLYKLPKKYCKVNECKLPYFSKGFCSTHYKRNYRYGSPMIVKHIQHKLSKTKEYEIWSDMIKRCYNPKTKNYHRYGGRGIKICDRWRHFFENFLEDMGKRPFTGAQIDRINNDGNYEPSNCEWVTNKENTRHTSTTKLSMEKANIIRNIYSKGELLQKEIAIMYGVSKYTISDVIRNKTWV